VNRILNTVSRRLAHFLSAPIKDYRPIVTCDPQCLAQVLRPGDILLIEGDSRISAAIRYLTQSTWSHAALYVGRTIDRHEPDGEPHVLVEAELDEGVISSPLSKYGQAHSRICRPVGLASEESRRQLRCRANRVHIRSEKHCRSCPLLASHAARAGAIQTTDDRPRSWFADACHLLDVNRPGFPLHPIPDSSADRNRRGQPRQTSK
jgi:hypothetical protein